MRKVSLFALAADCGIVLRHGRWAEPGSGRMKNGCSSCAPAFILALLSAFVVPEAGAAQPRVPTRDIIGEEIIGELQDRTMAIKRSAQGAR
jgi:hypothetical protein